MPGDRIGAGVVGSWKLPPLKGSVEDLRSSGESSFHGCFMEGRLAGAISTKKRVSILDIHCLFVEDDEVVPGLFWTHFEKAAAER